MLSISLLDILFIFLIYIFEQAGENEEDVMGEGVLRLLLQPWETREVAVVFTPSDHKPTTTILIIRYSVHHQGLKAIAIVRH